MNIGSKVVYTGRSEKNRENLKGVIGEITSRPTKDRVNASFKVFNKKTEEYEEHHLFVEPNALRPIG